MHLRGPGGPGVLMRPLIALAVLAALGCSGSGNSSSQPGTPQVAGLISVPSNNKQIGPPLPTPPPQSLAIVTSAAPAVALVGQPATITVLVLDQATNKPAQGAGVVFRAADPTRLTDGGTATTDAQGTATVSVIPLVAGSSIEDVIVTPQAFSGPVPPTQAIATIAVIGQ